MLGQLVFQGDHLFTESRVFPLTISHQNQNLMDPKKNCFMEMILLQNQEPEFYNIPHMISLYKIKDPYMLGKKGFRETIFYRIKFIPSYYLKTTTKSRSEDLTLRGMLY